MLLQGCHSVLSLIKSAGYEVALRVLASELVQAARAAQQLAPNTQSGSPDTGSQAAGSSMAALVKALALHVCKLPLVSDAASADITHSMPAFPKFQKLVQFLAEMKDSRPTWHGMVFVQERQGVFELLNMLQGAPDLAGINFYPFMSQGKAPAETYTTVHSSNTALMANRGMKPKEAKAQLQNFKNAKGQEVLVTTAAAEEGIDVPSCKFVVCYTVVLSGLMRTQRKGRARTKVAKFVEFVELGSDDARRQAKACEEQRNSQQAQQMHLLRCQDRVECT